MWCLDYGNEYEQHGYSASVSANSYVSLDLLHAGNLPVGAEEVDPRNAPAFDHVTHRLQPNSARTDSEPVPVLAVLQGKVAVPVLAAVIDNYVPCFLY